MYIFKQSNHWNWKFHWLGLWDSEEKVRSSKSSRESWVTLLWGYVASVWIIVETPNKILKIATNLIITHGEFYPRPHSGPKMIKKVQFPQRCENFDLDTNYFFRYRVTPKPQYLGTQFLARLLVRYLGLYQNIEIWPQRSFEVTGGQNLSFYFSPKCTFLYTFMFFSNYAYGPVNETHIFAKYRFRALFYILVFHNRPIFKKSIRGQTRGSQRSKRVN